MSTLDKGLKTIPPPEYDSLVRYCCIFKRRSTTDCTGQNRLHEQLELCLNGRDDGYSAFRNCRTRPDQTSRSYRSSRRRSWHSVLHAADPIEEFYSHPVKPAR